MHPDIFSESIHINLERRLVPSGLWFHTFLPSKQRIHGNAETLARSRESKAFLLLHCEDTFAKIKGVTHVRRILFTKEYIKLCWFSYMHHTRLALSPKPDREAVYPHKEVRRLVYSVLKQKLMIADA